MTETLTKDLFQRRNKILCRDVEEGNDRAVREERPVHEEPQTTYKRLQTTYKRPQHILCKRPYKTS